jgi:hypothetical protein
MTRSITGGLLLGGTLLAIAAVVKTGEHLHYISSDTAVRTGQCAIGLSLAFYANYIPKTVASGGRQTSLRVAGWLFMLAGIAYALLSAFAPRPLADNASIAAVATAVVLTIGYTVWVCVRSPRSTVQIMPPEA